MVRESLIGFFENPLHQSQHTDLSKSPTFVESVRGRKRRIRRIRMRWRRKQGTPALDADSTSLKASSQPHLLGARIVEEGDQEAIVVPTGKLYRRRCVNSNRPRRPACGKRGWQGKEERSIKSRESHCRLRSHCRPESHCIPESQCKDSVIFTHQRHPPHRKRRSNLNFGLQNL